MFCHPSFIIKIVKSTIQHCIKPRRFFFFFLGLQTFFSNVLVVPHPLLFFPLESLRPFPLFPFSLFPLSFKPTVLPEDPLPYQVECGGSLTAFRPLRPPGQSTPAIFDKVPEEIWGQEIHNLQPVFSFLFFFCRLSLRSLVGRYVKIKMILTRKVLHRLRKRTYKRFINKNFWGIPTGRHGALKPHVSKPFYLTSKLKSDPLSEILTLHLIDAT